MFDFGLNASDVRRIIWTFVLAFLSSLYFTATGWETLPNYDTGKAAAISAAVAGLAAVFSLVKNLLLADGSTLK